MTIDLATAAERKAKISSILTRKEKQSATSSGWSGSNVSPFRLRGLRFGFVRQRMATSRQQAGTRVAGSNTDITSAGVKCATKTSLTGSLNSPKPCQIFAGELLGT